MKKCFIFFYCLFALNSSNAQSEGSLSPRHLQEKIYLQTDKPYYYVGEVVWFSGYIQHRSQGLADTLSSLVYVELINTKQEIIQTLLLKADSGQVEGNFKIPSSMTIGIFALRAYTNWMRNYGSSSFFYKPIPLLALQDYVDEKAAKEITISDKVKLLPDKAFS